MYLMMFHSDIILFAFLVITPSSAPRYTCHTPRHSRHVTQRASDSSGLSANKYCYLISLDS